MKHNHPSTWRITKANAKPGASRSTEYLLPTPPGEDPMVLSSFAANMMLRVYDPDHARKPEKAGHFATVVKALIDKTGDLTKIRNVNLDAETTMREWLGIYEKAVRDHGKGNLLDARHSETAKQPEEPPELPNPDRKSPLYEDILVAAINGFCTHAGPIADPKLIAIQAKAVAEAYEEL